MIRERFKSNWGRKFYWGSERNRVREGWRSLAILLLATGVATTSYATSSQTPSVYAQSNSISLSAPCREPVNLTVNFSNEAQPGIIDEPAFNGDATAVTFWSTRDLTGENGDGNIEVFVAQITPTNGLEVSQLTDSVGSIFEGFNLSPVMSGNQPNQRVVFFSDQDLEAGKNSDASFEIFLAEVGDAGSLQQMMQLTDLRGIDSIYPTVSDDGRSVVFVSDTSLLAEGEGSILFDERKSHVYLAEVTDTLQANIIQITTEAESIEGHDEPAISGDGESIVFTRNDNDGKQIYIWRSSSGITQVSNPAYSKTNYSPTVSDDGRSIAYIATVSSTAGEPTELLRVATTEDTTSNEWTTIEIETSGNHSQPSISDDGQRIAFVAETSTATDGNQRQVYLAQLTGDSSTASVVMSGLDGFAENPSISGDGSKIVFVGIQPAEDASDVDSANLYLSDCPIADLSVELSGPATVNAGEFMTHTVNGTNNGPSTAESTHITYTLPAEATFLPDNSTQGCSTTTSPSTVTCQLDGALLPGADEGRAIEIVTLVSSSANPAPIQQQVAVSADAIDPVDTNNVATQEVVVGQSADLLLTSSGYPLSVNVQEELVYTIVISNTGPSDATSVVLTDTLSLDAVTYSNGAVTSGGSCEGSDPIVCAIGNISAYTAVTVTIPVTLTTSDETVITNTASVSAISHDPDETNNIAEEETDANKEADLTIEIDGPAAAIAGSKLTYILTATNLGPSAATQVEIINELPANTTFGEGDNSDCELQTGGTAAVCAIASIAIGSSEAVSLTLQSPSGSTDPVTNLATVSAKTRDPVSSNNESNAVVTTFTTQADISVTKSGSSNNVQAGASKPYSYTVAVENIGPSDAQGVVITDTLPAQVTFITASLSSAVEVGSSCAEAPTGTVVCRLGSVMAGTTSTATLVITVDPGAASAITNSVSGSTTTDDPDLLNNSDFFITDVDRPADLAVSKSASPSIVIAGQDAITYTIYVTNTETADATGVVITDTLPTGLTYDSSVPPGACVSAGQLVRCAVGDLLTGFTSQAVSLVATVDSDAQSGSITNVITVTSDMDDPVADNNRYEHSAATISRTIDLSITQSLDNPTPNIQETLLFTVVVQNLGPSQATNVSVEHTLPSDLSYMGETATQGLYTSTTGIWEVGTIDTNDSAVLIISAAVDESAGGQTLTNQLRISAADETDSIVANNESQLSLRVPQVDLKVGQVIDNAAPSVDDVIQLTLSITNANAGSADAATNVVISNTLPAGLSFVPSVGENPAGSPYTVTVETLLWRIESIPSGQTFSIEITGTVPLTDSLQNVRTIDVRTYTNTLAIESVDQADLSDVDNRSVLPITISSADLSVEQISSTATPNYIDTVNLTVTVTNDGPDAAQNVLLQETLPSNIVVASASDPGYTAGLWSIPLLNAGDSKELIITGTFASPLHSGGVLTSTTLISASAQFDPDSTIGNQNEAEDDQASLALLPQVADLRVDKIASNSAPTLFETVQFTITVTNDGPDDATNLQIEDFLPPEVALVNSSVTAGTVITSAHLTQTEVLWTLPTLTAATSESMTISATIIGTGKVTTTAQITQTDQFDSDSVFGNGDSAEDDLADVVLSIGEAADLSIELTSTAPISANVGDLITYTILLQNDGPDTAYNIEAQSVFSGTGAAPFTINSAITSTPGNAFTATNGLWTIDSLQLNQVAQIDLVGTVTKSGWITHTIKIVSSESSAGGAIYDPTTAAGNVATSALSVPAAADVELTSSLEDGSTADIGDSVKFRLVATNRGPDDATDVSVSAPMPAGLTFSSVQGIPSPTYNSSTGLWEIGDLNADASAIILLTGEVSGSSAVTVTNLATVTASSQYDWNSNNNSTSQAISVRNADLALTMNSNVADININESVIYTVTITNVGPYTATNIVVFDALPTELTYQESATSVGSYSDATKLWSIAGPLDVDESAQLVLTATVNSDAAGATIVNEAQIAGSDFPDPELGNNVVTNTVTVIQIDLSIEIELVDSSPYLDGGEVEYIVRLRNLSATSATGVALTDTLPVELESISCLSFPDGNCNVNGQHVVMALSDALEQGELQSMSIKAEIAPGSSGKVITNTISTDDMAAEQGDPTQGNNSATSTFAVQGADLAIAKSVQPTSTQVEESVSLSVTISNLGSLATGQIVITDVIPSGLSLLTTTEYTVPVTAGTVLTDAVESTGILTWTLDSLATGASQALVYTTTVDSTSAGQTLSGMAMVASAAYPDGSPDYPDPDQGNNSASASVTVDEPTLQFDSATYTLVEGGATNEITLTLSSINATAAVTVNIVSSGGSASVGDDYSAVSQIATIAIAEEEITIPLTIMDDSLVDPNETFTLSLDSPQGATLSGNTAALITISDNNAVDLEISQSVSPSIVQPGQPLIYTLNFTNTGNGLAEGVVITAAMPISVSVTGIITGTIYGSESGNQLYRWSIPDLSGGANGQIQVAGSLSQTLNDDDTYETTTSIETSTAESNLVNNDGAATLTLQVPQVTFSSDRYSASEGSASAVITASVDPINAYAPITVTLATSDGSASALSDYVPHNGELVIPAGASTIVHTLAITDDDIVETEETIGLALSNPVGARLAITQSATLTVTSNDAVDLTINQSVSPASVLPGQPLIYTLNFTNTGNGLAEGVVITAAIPISMSVTGIMTGTLTQTDAENQLYSWSIPDLGGGGSSAIQITGSLSQTLSAGDTFTALSGIKTSTTEANEANNEDTASLTLQVPSIAFSTGTLAVSEALANAVVTVTTNTLNPYAPISVTLTLIDETAVAPGDYGPFNGELVIPAGASESTHSIAITNDAIAETDETIGLALTEPLGAVLGVTQTATLAVTNDDVVKLEMKKLVNGVQSTTVMTNTTITYTLAFTNVGDPIATNIIITDIVPASITNVAFTNSGVTITDTGHMPTYVWGVADLQPGASGIITITGITSPTLTTGYIVNNMATISTATLLEDGSETQRDSASGSATVTIGPYIGKKQHVRQRNRSICCLCLWC